MSRALSLAIGAVIGLLSLGVLVFSVMASQNNALGSDMAWAAPFLGTTGIIVGGIGLVIGAMVMGLGMGRWERPKPVTNSVARKHEGLRE